MTNTLFWSQEAYSIHHTHRQTHKYKMCCYLGMMIEDEDTSVSEETLCQWQFSHLCGYTGMYKTGEVTEESRDLPVSNAGRMLSQEKHTTTG